MVVKMNKYREVLEKIANYEEQLEDYYGGVSIDYAKFAYDIIDMAEKALKEAATGDPYLLLRKIKQIVNSDNFSALEVRAEILNLIKQFEKDNSCII